MFTVVTAPSRVVSRRHPVDHVALAMTSPRGSRPSVWPVVRRRRSPVVIAAGMASAGEAEIAQELPRPLALAR